MIIAVGISDSMWHAQSAFITTLISITPQAFSHLKPLQTTLRHPQVFIAFRLQPGTRFNSSCSIPRPQQTACHTTHD